MRITFMDSVRERPQLVRWAFIATLALIGALYVPTLVALFPLEHDLGTANPRGEDWTIYDMFARSILTDGWTMPVVQEAYRRPAGFGYPYFIAAVYSILGVRSEAVYLVQACLLIGTLLLLYVTFKRELSPAAGVLLLFLLTTVLYVDVFRSLTFRLLSENLLFPATAALIALTMRGGRTGGLGYFAAAGVVAGICFLARPNVVGYSAAVAVVVLRLMRERPFAWRLRAATLFLVAFGMVASLLLVRNYAVTNQLTLPVLTDRRDWFVPGVSRTERPVTQRFSRAASQITGRTLFILGIPQWLQPTFRVRPHWLLMWGGVGFYLWGLRRRSPPAWEYLVLALGVGYFAPLVAIGNLSSYGIRMLTPGIPLALVIVVRGLDVAISAPGNLPSADANLRRRS